MIALSAFLTNSVAFYHSRYRVIVRLWLEDLFNVLYLPRRYILKVVPEQFYFHLRIFSHVCLSACLVVYLFKLNRLDYLNWELHLEYPYTSLQYIPKVWIQKSYVKVKWLKRLFSHNCYSCKLVFHWSMLKKPGSYERPHEGQCHSRSILYLCQTE